MCFQSHGSHDGADFLRVFADEIGYPPLQSVIDRLEADEIVRPNDYMIPVGEEFNVKVDFTNIDIPDISKINIYLADAVDQDGKTGR